METNKKAIGERIKTIRMELGYNMRQFGEKIAFTQNIPKDKAPSDSIVSRWERGISLPSSDRLKTIAELGGCTVNELLYGDPKSYLNKLLWESSLGFDFSSVTFDKFYDSLIESDLNDLYLSEEEAVQMYKIFEEQNKRDENIVPLGAYIHKAYEQANESTKLFLTEAEHHYISLFGLSFKDADNDFESERK